MGGLRVPPVYCLFRIALWLRIEFYHGDTRRPLAPLGAGSSTAAQGPQCRLRARSFLWVALRDLGASTVILIMAVTPTVAMTGKGDLVSG